jgi:hypothetical protein
MRLMLDRAPPIRASLRDVERALLIAVALVIIVVFLFLGNVRAALIPSVAVPVSLLGTAGVMYLFDYSLDNLSLMALTIATGFVVDDAIVVLENISRHIEDGMPPRIAAFQGAREITFTVLSMSASLIAVFIPILLMGGMVGRLFREFAVTLSVAIVISLVVSITSHAGHVRGVAPPPQREREAQAGPQSARRRRRDPPLRPHLEVGVAPPAHDAVRHGADRRGQRRPLHDRAQGILPDRRHRPAHRRAAGRTGRVLSDRLGEPQGGLPDHRRGSGGRRRDGVYRRRRRRPRLGQEHGAPLRAPQTVWRAR